MQTFSGFALVSIGILLIVFGIGLMANGKIAKCQSIPIGSEWRMKGRDDIRVKIIANGGDISYSFIWHGKWNARADTSSDCDTFTANYQAMTP